MGSDNRLAHLMATLFGVFVGIFAALQALETGYLGFGRSYLFVALALAAAWMIGYGLSGLLEREIEGRSLLLVFVAAVPVAWFAPAVSRAYHVDYEQRSWREVSVSNDTMVWKNRYLVRVPETFRRPQWRSGYARAVAAFSLEADEYSTLRWYCEQAFREHRDWYDDGARQALSESYRTVFGKRLKVLEESPAAPPTDFLAGLGRLGDYLAQDPSRALAWDLKRKWADPARLQVEAAVKTSFPNLLTFRDGPPRPDDVRWLVGGQGVAWVWTWLTPPGELYKGKVVAPQVEGSGQFFSERLRAEIAPAAEKK